MRTARRSIGLPPSRVRRNILGLLGFGPLLAACGGTSVLSQADLQPVPAAGRPNALSAPMIRVGDEWKFVMRSGLTGLVVDRVRAEVTAVDADGYTVAETWQTAGSVTARYDRNLNPLRSGNVVYEPAYPRFSFPLSIDKSWRGQTVAREQPRRLYGVLRQDLRANVHGWERLTVPAGIFTALRVDINIDWQNPDNAQSRGSSMEAFWYAADVRNIVLHHRLDFENRVETSNSVTELESFRLGN